MRLRPRTTPELGETRQIRKFLWLPLQLQNDRRWLEFAWIEETWTVSSAFPEAGSFGWKPTRFRRARWSKIGSRS